MIIFMKMKFCYYYYYTISCKFDQIAIDWCNVRMHEHFESDPKFKQWYKDKYLSKMQDEQEEPYIGQHLNSLSDKISWNTMKTSYSI